MGISASLLAFSVSALAQVGGPELTTDHPYYPGEGAMSTPLKATTAAMAVPRGTLGSASGRDQMIRLFLWRGEHYAHLYSPAVYNLPATQPDPTAGNQLMTDYDAMRAMFSYGRRWPEPDARHRRKRRTR